MWAGKWVLAALLGTDGWFLPNLLAKITERSTFETTGTVITLRMLFSAVLGVFAKKAYLALAALLALGYAVLLLRGKRRKSPESVTAPQAGKHSNGQALLLSLAALLPILWYVLASNHSYNHG